LISTNSLCRLLEKKEKKEKKMERKKWKEKK